MLGETAAEGVIILAYCLMPNHFHLLLQAAINSLSRSMHSILTSHAAYMNKKYGRTGHLFQDRFKTILCDPEIGVKPLVRYIHRNPVKAGLISRPEQWPWSSHRDFMNPASEMPPGKIEVLKLFGANREDAIRSYAEYMEPDPEFIRAQGRGKFPLDKLAAMVERELGHFPGFLRQRSHQHDLTGARAYFVHLAMDAGFSAKEVAEFLCLAEDSVYRLKRGWKH